MKKSFILSLIIHIALLAIILIAATMVPDEKKSEAIKIKILVPQTHQTVTELPLVSEAIRPEKMPPLPSKPTPPTPVAQPPLQSAIKPSPIVPSPTAPVAPVQIQKSVEAPVQKTVETPMPKSVVPKAAPIETVKIDPKAKESYVAYIRQLIDDRKVYPKNAKRLKQMGTTTVRFKILEDGTIKNISVADSSGFELLDQSAKDLLENIGRFKAIPKELGNDSIDLAIPIEYTLR